MKKYITEYIQNTLLFLTITIIWNLLEDTPLNWLSMIGQALFFGLLITLVTVWYSRRRSRNNDSQKS